MVEECKGDNEYVKCLTFPSESYGSKYLFCFDAETLYTEAEITLESVFTRRNVFLMIMAGIGILIVAACVLCCCCCHRRCCRKHEAASSQVNGTTEATPKESKEETAVSAATAPASSRATPSE